jgi:hypothetical protein
MAAAAVVKTSLSALLKDAAALEKVASALTLPPPHASILRKENASRILYAKQV